jgi:hypothetical protein
LYAAELTTGDVFVYDGNWNRVGLPANRFSPPGVSNAFGAYGIYANDHVIYVTFAQRDSFSGTEWRWG